MTVFCSRHIHHHHPIQKLFYTLQTVYLVQESYIKIERLATLFRGMIVIYFTFPNNIVRILATNKDHQTEKCSYDHPNLDARHLHHHVHLLHS